VLNVALASALAACRASTGESSGSEGDCDEACVAAGVVEVLSGTTASGASAICAGSVVGSGDDGAWILTAAHCASSHGPLWVRASSRSSTLRVAKTAIDARFKPTLVSALHDLGLLLVPELRGLRPVPVTPNRLRPGTREALRLVTQDKGQLGITEVTSRNVRSLTAMVHGDEPICRGQSGAPVLGRYDGSWMIIGLVSKGPRECASSATIGLTSRSDVSMLVHRLSGKPAPQPAPTCIECLEELAAGASPCSTTVGRCERDPVCSAKIDALRMGTADLLAAAAPDSRYGAIHRCLCSTDCRAPCGAICAPATAP
jgi:hypothetical protein